MWHEFKFIKVDSNNVKWLNKSSKNGLLLVMRTHFNTFNYLFNMTNDDYVRFTMGK